MISISDPGLLPVLALFGLAVFVAFPLIVLSSNEAKPIAFLQSKLGLNAVWAPVLLIGAALWTIVFGFLIFGLLSVIWEIVQGVFWRSTEGDKTHDGRFALVRLTAITATTGAVIAFPMTLIKVKLTRDANETTVQGQITDRINKAVEGLGTEKTVKRQRHDQDGNPTYEKDTKGSSDYSKPVFVETSEPNLEVRIGSIFALERIARESPDFHIQVMGLLCTYIRLNSPVTGAAKLSFYNRDAENSAHHGDESSGQCPSLRIDIQTALDALGRRSETNIRTQEAFANFKLRLNGCNLQGAQITGNWNRADLSDSALEQASFSNASFVETDFRRSRLSKLAMAECSFENAKIERAELRFTNFEPEQIQCFLTPSDYGHWGPTIENCELKVNGVPIPDALRVVRSSKIRGMIFRSRLQFDALTSDRDGYQPSIANTLCKCALRRLDLSKNARNNGCFSNLLADGTVSNWPTSAPDHWIKKTLSDDEFDEEFFKWLNDPDNNTPPTTH
ncbi:pentapeptide repeat-containing protein [Phaeobacter sp. BS52]|uniref:pentapeptide repeat-containing protein n=1 Tax=Phaeobacter sp. BS52 TaxID=2907241 RepID=UPI00386E28D3